MRKRRVISWLLFCSICLVVLLVRLMEIQLFRTETFSKHHINLLEESVKQRSQELVIDNGRGNFHDRNGSPLVNKKVSVLVMFPFLKNMEWDIEKVADILKIPPPLIKSKVEQAKKPFVFTAEQSPLELSRKQAEGINALQIPGVFAIEKSFERNIFPAGQLIGIVGENPHELERRYPNKKLPEKTVIGISGLEQSFDEFLLPDGKAKLIYHVDGTGAPLYGADVRYVDPANPFYPVNVRTTIDKEIQEQTERLVDSFKIKKGGLVLINLADNSILAMVSRPAVVNKNPYQQSGITNMMVKQQIIGSIFKTVTAAAAIDYNLVMPSRLFDCSKKINGKPELVYNYGMLNFSDSFARSCNHTFGQLAQELQKIDSGILENYADKLSLIGPVGWEGNVFHIDHFKQVSEEEKGRVFFKSSEQNDANFAAQAGIGQHEVRATPLAVANMMATIARGGKKEMVRAVTKIEYKNGSTMIGFPEKNIPGESISPFIAMRLQKLLREVVVNKNGTGRWFQNLPYEVAGKSGTAETGKFERGMQLHNKWFAGYFPYHQPKYALVAVSLDVADNEPGVNQLFAEVVKMLYRYEKKE
ncbi:MAG: penicillin-binding transpeptidase domain-containing protein [Bacillota bacterium]|nr:penicillin-binding transpeptidase domain-containing protein [Bacillota bacterium]